MPTQRSNDVRRRLRIARLSFCAALYCWSASTWLVVRQIARVLDARAESLGARRSRLSRRRTSGVRHAAGDGAARLRGPIVMASTTAAAIANAISPTDHQRAFDAAHGGAPVRASCRRLAVECAQHSGRGAV